MCNLVEVARLIARADLLREESRGSHYRSDFPHRDDGRWLRNIYLTRRRSGDGDGAPDVEVRPVDLTRLAPAQAPAAAAG